MRRAIRSCWIGIFALVAVACGNESSGPAPVLNPNPPLVVGSAFSRPASVVLPADYDTTKSYPLVILLHGYGVNAQTQDFIFGLTSRATRFQFILVLPDGTVGFNGSRFWDATPECCNFAGTPVDDVGYLASLMEEAMELYAVDRDRIRLVGHSNGGYMAYRYMCEHPIEIDRVAVLAGSTFLDESSCADPQPIDILHLHGTNDDTILYPANLPPAGDSAKVETIGAEATVARWTALSRCDDELSLVESRDYLQRVRNGDNPAETDILRAEGCRAGNSIELWRSVNADHLFIAVNDAWRDGVAAFLSE